MPRDIPPLHEVRRITQKKRDAWWTVLLVDPVATPLVRVTAKWTRITPNQITWAALLLGLVSAGFFAMGDWRWLIVGAVLYHVSFILDCMDGKVARLTGRGSVFGAWLDYIFDRIRVMACAIALMWGQYDRTGDTVYIWLAAGVVFLDGLRYLNALEIFKTRHNMRKQIKARMRAARQAEDESGVAFMEDLLRDNPEADIEHDNQTAQTAAAEAAATPEVPAQRTTSATATPGATATPATAATVTTAETVESDESDGPATPKQVIDLQQEFRHRFPAYLRFRSFLLRHRIRTHLISGIEFQMGVFIVGPLLDAVIPVTLVSGAMLLVFELAIVYKLLLSTRDFTRTLDSFDLDERKMPVTTA
ncbi:CDP-alcohol phosphatidyltransferase family protein [Streptomyces sp. NPDC091292]|uniref:CDP-alcohol phosphatidyltransferase family protein n=1 Tax=Streptomyces sp. NPDC091292 TaxID=3365991 RepID=UPI003822A274